MPLLKANSEGRKVPSRRETHIMLTQVFCMTEEEATRVFYEPGRFTWVGALLQTTLGVRRGLAQG
jgi:hypothetical protein